jgi:hypothetical protein
MPMTSTERQVRYREVHKDELREKRLARYWSNRDAYLRKQREWQRKNRAYFKKWDEKNHEQRLETARAAYHRNHEESKKKARDKNRKYQPNRLHQQRTAKRIAVAALGGRCVDCGFNGHPSAFHFDHRDPSTKLHNVSQIFSHRKEILNSEISKCDLRCGNCHFVKTSKKGNSDWRSRIKARFIEKLGGRCFDCNSPWPIAVFQFDHRDPSTKIECVSVLLRNGRIQEIESEIEKCDLVCANCHAVRTWGKEK